MILALLAPGTGLRRLTRQQLAHERDAAREEARRLRRRDAKTDAYVAALLTDMVTANDALAYYRQAAGQAEEQVVQLAADLEDLQAQAGAQFEELVKLRQMYANDHRVQVRPMVRDTDDMADQATEPQGIHVQPLWDALGQQPQPEPVPRVVLTVTPIPPEDADGKRFAGLVR